MQRVLVMVVMVVVVVAAVGAGALMAHWPFWQRAWQWHSAEEGWPRALPGPTVQLRGGSEALSLHVTPDAVLAQAAAGSSTQVLLRADRDGNVGAFFAAGFNADTSLDGRGLVAGLLAPLYGVLGASGHSQLLDEPIGKHIIDWRDQARGDITPRQLLLQLSGLPASVFRPLNPFMYRAQLAAGPDFRRAALQWHATYPPGSHFEPSPVNAQLLAVLAEELESTAFAQLLERELWSRFAANAAVGMLDHRRGNLAAHCCLHAAAADWLRFGLLLANDGRVGDRQVLPSGFVQQMQKASPVHPDYGLGFRLVHAQSSELLLSLETKGRRLLVAPNSGRALLWMGEGEPPPLEQLMR
jgi:hypothetical protein